MFAFCTGFQALKMCLKKVLIVFLDRLPSSKVSFWKGSNGKPISNGFYVIGLIAPFVNARQCANLKKRIACILEVDISKTYFSKMICRHDGKNWNHATGHMVFCNNISIPEKHCWISRPICTTLSKLGLEKLINWARKFFFVS